MTKLLPALAIVLATGLAAPAMAASDSFGSSTFDSDYVLAALQDKGVDAVNVAQDWNDKLRVGVKQPDGSVIYQLFDANSLQPVATDGSRVLSNLDVTRTATPLALTSLAGNTNID